MGKRDILESLGDFSNKEGWDKFFAGRQLDNPYEWYVEWPELCDLLLSHLSASSASQILIPGCGVSRLSEHLYDVGFQSITNIDFAKVAISNMSRRNTRQRPYMRWRVMDMTSMQFLDESFDAIIDKGGLDALVEAEDGAMLANQYLSEMKRVTKSGGKFICFTFAEPHVLGLLFSELRRGWKTSIEAVAENSAKKAIYPSFMVVAEKSDDSTSCHPLMASLALSSFHFNATQATEFHEAVEKENKIREEYSKGNYAISHSLEGVQFGDKREPKNLHKHAWIKHILGARMLEEAIA
ncbi:methyltransferase-like protein 13 [Momordica charantia]|uniref:Methyltransferase-like protein 13 n=1 Tax=Momordica charantia TaxID=3673 RepID=A0A6J1CCT6_MOMCH|nr:methyltransferase-like protein 13 [Momordica charantia]